jgi:hypothetical protein
LYGTSSTARPLERQGITKRAIGNLDGLVALGDALLVTSWTGNAICRGKLGGSFEVLVVELKSLADGGCDTKRGRLPVPLLLKNTVLAQVLKQVLRHSRRDGDQGSAVRMAAEPPLNAIWVPVSLRVVPS